MSTKGSGRYDSGYGQHKRITFGDGERKAVAAATVDIECHHEQGKTVENVLMDQCDRIPSYIQDKVQVWCIYLTCSKIVVESS